MMYGERMKGATVSQSSLIQKLQCFTTLDDRQCRQLESLAGNVEQVDAKRDIVSEGDKPEHVYLMLQGWAARYKMLPDGSRQIVAFLLPGDLCDIHLTMLRHLDHGILALSPCKVALIDGGALTELAHSDRKIGAALAWLSLVDKSILRNWIVNNGRRDAHTRISHLLCELHARMSMVGLVQASHLDLPLTQEDLADATGLTGVHTNRVLQRLRFEGLIELRHRVLTLPNPEALRQAAGFDPIYLHLRAGGVGQQEPTGRLQIPSGVADRGHV